MKGRATISTQVCSDNLFPAVLSPIEVDMSPTARLQPSTVPRVFVVEDEALIAMELLDRVGEYGYQACGHAATGEHALLAIAQARPDVVLMDIHLGAGMDGIDTARRLQEILDVPVVFLTAYCDAALVGRAARVDAFGYVLKPFRDQAVRAALAMALARHYDARTLRDANAALSANQERGAALKGIVPICMHCNKICDAERRWHRLEVFLSAHTHAQFSHGYCPECARQAYLASGFAPPLGGDES